jgi:hypothetical protein
MHVFLELLGILEYLHGRVPPILHRDIKPSNIIVRPNGFPALVDFGSVRRVFLTADEAGSTVAGTYGYMPYEQYMGQASPSSDLYATAATLLHLVTGRAPREFMTAEGRIEVPAALPGDARLRAVLARMLRPSPAERFASARDVREALLAPVADAGIALVTRGASSGVVSRAAVTGTVSGTALRRDAANPDLPAAPRHDVAIPDLPAAPRDLAGSTKEQFNAVAHSMWVWMDPNRKHRDGWSLVDVGSMVFFSVLTAGILPMVFYSYAHSRRRRLRRFFRLATPGVATITGFAEEDAGFSVKYSRVSYEFEADGVLHRDADVVIPAIANRWREGDRVQILYFPTEGYDSVIISAS